MRRTIHRFDVPINEGVQTIPVDHPDNVVLVSDSDRIQTGVAIWAEVDLDFTPFWLPVQVFGTGHPIPSDAVHLGSWSSGPFVWHLYAVTA